MINLKIYKDFLLFTFNPFIFNKYHLFSITNIRCSIKSLIVYSGGYLWKQIGIITNIDQYFLTKILFTARFKIDQLFKTPEKVFQ